MSKQKQMRAMDELDEQDIVARHDPIEAALDHYLAEGKITNVLYPVKRGKEAVVYCCQAHPATGMDLLAAKIYRPRNHRAFKNDAVYQEGRFVSTGQTRRALAKKSRFGREMQFGLWVNHEFEVLNTLARVYAATPRPIAHTQTSILMEYFGDRERAAPSLGGVDLALDEASAVFESVLSTVELLLAHNVIHGDLSAYNILYWQGAPKIIDFPQSVDPRFNSNALALLMRDIENICRHMAGYGLVTDSRRIAERLWHQFRNARL